MKFFNRHNLYKAAYLLILITFSWCVEPYNFRIENNEPTLVIESFISNKSFNDTRGYPSDGRFFWVKIKLTSDVINIYDKVVSNARVILTNKSNSSWEFSENSNAPGTYILYDENFKAEYSEQYLLRIITPEGEIYESSWEKVPDNNPLNIGEVSFQETEKQEFVVEASEEVIRTFPGIETFIHLPKSKTSKPIFYKWDFTPTWEYHAPFASSSQGIRSCWITDHIYLSNYVLHRDNVGGYPQELVFIKTDGHDRIYNNFSLLIRQYAMNEGYYTFWKEVQEQTQKGGLFDSPPFNLKTNFKGINTTKKVSGYFGVVDEQATRWYFNRNDLSYNVIDNTRELCEIVYGPPGSPPGGPECYSCLEYPSGEATNQKPEWWED